MWQGVLQTKWFIVVKSIDNWWVDCEGQSYGPFPGQREAEDAARWLAKAIGDPVRELRVYAPDAGGASQLIWASTWPDDDTGASESLAIRQNSA